MLGSVKLAIGMRVVRAHVECLAHERYQVVLFDDAYVHLRWMEFNSLRNEWQTDWRQRRVSWTRASFESEFEKDED